MKPYPETWTRATEDGFAVPWRLDDARQAALDLAERTIGLDRIHAAQQRLAHVALPIAARKPSSSRSASVASAVAGPPTSRWRV